VSLAAALLALAACGSGPSEEQGIAFEPNVKVSDFGSPGEVVSTRSAGQRAIAVYGQSVFVLWQDTRGSNRIVVARSDDGGATFGEGVPVRGEEAVASKAAHPALAVDREGALYVAWADVRESGPGIYVAKSPDGGRTFGPSVRVNDVPVAYSRTPTLAVGESGQVFVAWEDYRHDPRAPDIYFSRSADGGRTFGRNFLINDDQKPEAPLAIVAPGPEPIAPDGPSARGPRAPALALDGRGGVFVAWGDARRGHADIYFARSSDGGASFGANVRVNDVLGEKWRGAPSLAVGPKGEIYLAWEDRRNDRPDIFVARSVDGGLAFLPGVQINRIVIGGGTTVDERLPPAIAVDSRGIITVAWRGPRALPHIHVARSGAAAQTFSDAAVVDDAKTPIEPTPPNLTVDAAGRVFIAWADNRVGGGPFHEVFLARSR
jgi:hypothetical protein